MLIGYASVSKADGSQSLDLQRNALRPAGLFDIASRPNGGLLVREADYDPWTRSN